MKITKLELKNYKRIPLSNAKLLIYEPLHKLQLILGTNGSGKSSMLKELSPLPANASDYNTDGYKIIEISHKGDNYVLKSSFGSGCNRFSFIRNDEELNKSGTISVYKELVKSHFNITTEIHNLLTGLTKFTEMSVNDRRNLFTKLSDRDYTFAFDVYNKLKENLRDLQGSVKLYQSRLVTETNKVLSKDQEIKINKEIADLTELLHLFISYKTPVKYTKQQLEKYYEEVETALLRDSLKLVNVKGKFLNTENFTSIEAIDGVIFQNTVSMNVLKKNNEDLLNCIEKAQTTLKLLGRNNLDSISDLDKRIVVLDNELFETIQSLVYKIKYRDEEKTLSILTSLTPRLLDIFSNLEKNEDRKYNRDNFTKANDQVKNINTTLEIFNKQLSETNSMIRNLEHLKDHGLTECPKCQYQWFKGFDQTQYDALKQKAETINNNITSLNELLQQQNKYIETATEYFSYYNSYIQIKKEWDLLNPIFSYLDETEIVFKNPKGISFVINNCIGDLKILIQANSIKKEINNLTELKYTTSKDQLSNINNLEKEIQNLQQVFFTNSGKINEYVDHNRLLNFYKRTAENVNSISEQIRTELKNREDYLYGLLDVLRRDTINEYINIVQLEISKREQIISKVNLQNSIVRDLENQIKENNEKIEVLKIAVREMSPSEGLIAKSLTGFINHIVKQLNAFISKVWLYPLEIVPIIPDEKDDSLDLDYKFAIKIKDKKLPSDIALGSAGMKEIINLAFVIVAVPYLNLGEIPIYLDEFGANLDEAHRETAFDIINSILTNSNYSQVFLISHYRNSYGSLKNADFTVLCSENITIPKDIAFNKVTTLK